MAGRKIRDEADARACIAAVKASGKEPAAWARARGIDARSLRAWTLNLGRSDRTAPGARAPGTAALVELVPEIATTERSTCVIRIGAASVEVLAGFDEVMLRRVLPSRPARPGTGT